MQGKGVKLGSVFVVIMVLGFLVSGPKSVECAFSIQLNPSSLSQCLVECQKALQEKYLSATGSRGKSMLVAWESGPKIHHNPKYEPRTTRGFLI
ncbi:hypothetical protein Peur_072411 [Populus x canadensis]